MSRKEVTVTFKADENLLQALDGIPNRSAFIRDAVLSALDNLCPLCRGAGFLTPEQKIHWNEFSQKHHVAECEDCHARYLVCEAEKKK